MTFQTIQAMDQRGFPKRDVIHIANTARLLTVSVSTLYGGVWQRSIALTV